MDFRVDELQISTGVDIPVEPLGLTIRQPTVKEISMLGETNYFLALQVCTVDKKTVRIASSEVTNWMLFNEVLKQKMEGVKNLRILVTNFLQLFFIDKITIGPRSLIIQQGAEIVNIEPEQFELLQEIIAAIGGKTLLSAQEEQYNPGNQRAAEIAEKMKKAHKRLAAMEPKPKSKGFLSRYIKAVATVTSNSLEQALAMTIMQLNEVMQTYLAWESYDLEIRSRLAGAKGDDKITHWMMREEEDPTSKSIGSLSDQQ